MNTRSDTSLCFKRKATFEKLECGETVWNGAYGLCLVSRLRLNADDEGLIVLTNLSSAMIYADIPQNEWFTIVNAEVVHEPLV